MRIGISTRGIGQGSFAVSELIKQITHNMLEINHNHEIFLYSNLPDFIQTFASRANLRVYQQDNRFVFDQLWLPWALKKDQIDLSLFFKGTIPLLSSINTAVMILDLGYYYPELNAYKILETQYMKTMLRLSAAKAKIIFSISQFTKDDVVRIFGINPSKVHVSHLAASPIFSTKIDNKQLAAVREKYQLPEKTIFFPTSISPRKNLIRTLHAFDNLQNKIPHTLLLTGGTGWNSKKINKLITQFPEKVIRLGHVPNEEIPILFALADFAIYPSLFEGFGIPILEAFNCGCPVLTSNTTSMPEVARDAALLVNPYSVESIAEGILELATNNKLRERLRKKGLQRANLFSYQKTAKIILEAIEQSI